MELKNKLTEARLAKGLNEDLLKARRSSLNEFSGIEHRLELVTERAGVEYINDSKATDVNSTWYSLEFMEKPVVWIVGLSDIDTDYSIFSELVGDKVKAIICLGENKEGALNSLLANVDCFAEASSIKEATQIASSIAMDGDVVLFSPACSSFHLFQNYKDRGQQFSKTALEL
jgi:UDP-N-acetylmuramoylalanine--D-glutamate ligase